jgi:hypothetical protein
MIRALRFRGWSDESFTSDVIFEREIKNAQAVGLRILED